VKDRTTTPGLGAYWTSRARGTVDSRLLLIYAGADLGTPRRRWNLLRARREAKRLSGATWEFAREDLIDGQRAWPRTAWIYEYLCG